MSTATITLLIAGWAALVSTILGVIRLIEWRQMKRSLRVTLKGRIEYDDLFIGWPYIKLLLTVKNGSKVPNYVESIEFEIFDTKADITRFGFNHYTPPTLPVKLEFAQPVQSEYPVKLPILVDDFKKLDFINDINRSYIRAIVTDTLGKKYYSNELYIKKALDKVA